MLDTFLDGRSRQLPPITFQGHTYRIWFEKGSWRGGADHISIKHLIDGGYAFAGGFTLQELDVGLNNFASATNIRRESSGKDITIDWSDSNGKQWRLVALFLSKRWVVNSIYVVNTSEEETLSRVRAMYPTSTYKQKGA